MTTRLSGTTARLFTAALSTPLIGDGLRRVMARTAVTRALAHADLPAEPYDVPRVATDRAPLLDGAATDLAVAYREGRLSPIEVTARALAAAASLDRRRPPMRAFLYVDEHGARAAAESSAERYRRGAPRSPLDGVPIAIKDEIDVAGAPTSFGTSFASAASRDSDVVDRLRRAGAVVLGKTNMHELGAGPTGVNPHHGDARNPFDPERDAGGSSSGSAAAVASGIVPLSIGTDSGGSLRVPGSLCGVVALKPTFGRVSTAGARLVAPSLEHFGPLGATTAYVARAMEILTGETFAFPALETLRIGVCDAWWSSASPQVSRIVRARVHELVTEIGGSLHAIELPHLSLAPSVMAATFGVEGARSLERPLASLGTSARLAFELGRALPAADYARAQRARTLVAADFAAALELVDVIVTPTTAITAPRIPSSADALDPDLIERLVGFTVPANLTGLPAVQVPCGYDEDGLPVGLQVIGAHGDDALLLAVAHRVEARSTHQRPRVWYDIIGGVSR
jgi:Asp-tRNA(Asn)/Glu-tRNA(Gln) amidotransferase A subunit family amidase